MTWTPNKPGKQLCEVHMTLEDRFWAKVRVADGCWEWTATKDSHGYGRVMLGGVRRRAHRFALIFATGQNPEHLEALHSCDNPGCCNPQHLRWGTHKENMADRRERNRGFVPTGEKHGAAKIDDAAAYRIKFGGERAIDLMREYNVAKSVIYHIRQGRSWTHIGRQHEPESSFVQVAATPAKTSATGA